MWIITILEQRQATRLHIGCREVAYQILKWLQGVGFEARIYLAPKPAQRDYAEVVRANDFMESYQKHLTRVA